MTSWIRSLNVFYKRPNEICWVDADLSSQLDNGESLTGTPSVTAPSGSELTCNSASIVGTKVRFRVSGGKVGRFEYCVVVSVGAVGGPGVRTIERECRIMVVQCTQC